MMNKKIYDRILVEQSEIQDCVRTLADELNTAYQNCDSVTGLVILEGARIFAEDLFAMLDFPIQAEYLRCSSYYGGTESAGSVKISEPDGFARKITGKDVLIIDDIYDTGITLSSLIDHFQDYNPKSLKTCVLLEKQVPHTKTIEIDFLGTEIEDAFVIGYGLDYDGKYRDLPFIAELSASMIQ